MAGDVGLVNAGAIAGGVQSFMQAYQGAQQQQRQNAFAQQEAQQKAQLYNMQMQKLQQEIMPTTIDLGKVNFATQAYQSGLADKSMVNYAQKQAMDNISSPAQLAYAQQVLNQHVQQRNSGYGLMGQPQDQSSMGSGMDALTNKYMDPSQTASGPSQQPDQSQSQGYSSTPITLNKAELEMVKQINALRSSENITAARMGSQESQNLQKIQGAQDLEKAKGSNLITRDMLNQQAKGLSAQDANDTKLKVANIGAGARVDAATIAASRPRGGGSGKVAADPAVNAIISSIKNLEAAKAKLFTQPSTGLLPPNPDQIAAKASQLDMQAKQLMQRYKAATGKNFPGEVDAPPPPAAPANQAGSSGPNLQALPWQNKDASPIGSVLLSPKGVRVIKVGQGKYVAAPAGN